MEKLQQDKLVSTIRSATAEVFSTMLDIPAESLPHETEQPGSHPYDGIVGLVGLAGSWVGAGRISCSAPLACKISGALLGSEYTAVNEDVLDAMAEVTNMIIGNVKSTLEDELGPMGLSIPTVIFGRNYQARSSGAKEWVVVPFDCSGDRFEVRFVLVPDGRAGDTHRSMILQEIA
jgi:chemotaxis protein CheX